MSQELPSWLIPGGALGIKQSVTLRREYAIFSVGEQGPRMVGGPFHDPEVAETYASVRSIESWVESRLVSEWERA